MDESTLIKIIRKVIPDISNVPSDELLAFVHELEGKLTDIEKIRDPERAIHHTTQIVEAQAWKLHRQLKQKNNSSD